MTMDLKSADEKAAKVVEILAPFCARIEIAGSPRRRRPEVGDIDLVIEPKPGKRRYIRDRCLSWHPAIIEDGQINLLFTVKGVQIDIFFADEFSADSVQRTLRLRRAVNKRTTKPKARVRRRLRSVVGCAIHPSRRASWVWLPKQTPCCAECKRNANQCGFWLFKRIAANASRQQIGGKGEDNE